MEHSGDIWLGFVVFCAFGVIEIGAAATALVLLARRYKITPNDPDEQERAFPVIPIKPDSSSKSN